MRPAQLGAPRTFQLLPPRAAVEGGPLFKSESAPRPGRPVKRNPGSLDQNRSRPAHRIDQRLIASVTRPPKHRGCQRLPGWRHRGFLPIAPAMQQLAGGVHAYGADVAIQEKLQEQRASMGGIAGLFQWKSPGCRSHWQYLPTKIESGSLRRDPQPNRLLPIPIALEWDLTELFAERLEVWSAKLAQAEHDSTRGTQV